VSDVLTRVLARLADETQRAKPVSERIRGFWTVVMAARHTLDHEIIEPEFMRFARESRLIADLDRHGREHGRGQYGDEDVRHVLRWGLLGRDPFGTIRHAR
jgi:hypothetical protein